MMLNIQQASAAISFRAVASSNTASGSTSLDISRPTGLSTNDVMIAIVSSRGGSGTTITPPGGWSLINTRTVSTTLLSSTYYKVATGSEPLTYSFTLSPSRQASGIVVAYSGVDTTNPINTDAVQNYTSSTTLTSPSITTTVNNAWIIAAFTHGVTTTLSAGSGMTLRAQDASTGLISSGLQDGIQASSGVSGTKNMTAADAAGNIGHTIALKPAATGSGISQVSFRFFRNSNSPSASDPLEAIDTNVTIPASQAFRMRINLGVSSGSMTTSNAYKLQYAPRSTGDNTCDTGFSGETYSDVGASTPVAFYTDNGVNDGLSYYASSSDPARSGITAVGQSYESINPMAVTTTVSAGQDSLWDIALTTVGVSDGQAYCLRVVDNTSGALGSYSVVPQVTIDSLSFTQSNYRWFANANSLTPGSALAAQDTAITASPHTPVRLRQRLGVDSGMLYANGADFKLQFAEKSGSCDTAFSGESYADLPTIAMVSTNSVTRTASTTGSTANGAWVNPSNAVSDNNQYAYTTYVSNGVAEYLRVVGDPPAIPAGASISGFRAWHKGYYQGDVTTQGKIVISGTVKGSSRILSFSPLNSLISNGSNKDLWGASWSASEINAATSIGIEIMPDQINTFGTPSLKVDNSYIDIFYISSSSGEGLIFTQNASLSDGAAISSSGNDPANARTAVYQRYQESQPFANESNIPSGQDGLWDFAIVGDDMSAGKTFCVRTVKSDGELLNTYSFIPEITYSSAIDGQTRGGGGVSNGVKSRLTW